MLAISKFKKNRVKVSVYSPNHFVIRYHGVGVAFQSYDSTVAFRDLDGKIYLGSDWDYSRTTMKYLGQWLGQNTAETRKDLASGRFILDEGL